MANHQIRVSRRMLFTWFMLGGFIFLLAPQNLTNRFQFAFARIFRWPLSIGRGVSLSARTYAVHGDVVSRYQYNRLQNHLANVTQWLHQERQRVEKLSGLRNRSVWKGVNFVLADIITTSEGAHNKLIINRGEDDGLAEGQFVLAEYSIIGTISEVSSRTSQVKLVTDSTSKIAVKIEGLNAGRIMQGDGKDSGVVRLVKHRVKIGSDVYTDKKPGFLDTPMIVGTVAQCKRNDENPLLWDITVKPVCEIERFNDVDVIVMNPQE